MSEIGEMVVWRTARGLARYQIEVWHHGLHRYQMIRADSSAVLASRARALAAQWDERWARRVAREDAARDAEAKAALAADRTADAQSELGQLRALLAESLDDDHTVDWAQFVDTQPYDVPRPLRPSLPPSPKPPVTMAEPKPDDPEYRPRIGLLDRVSSARRQARVAEATDAYKHAHEYWVRSSQDRERTFRKAIEQHAADQAAAQARYEQLMDEWNAGALRHQHEQARRNADVERLRDLYHGRDPDAVERYCITVLERSPYPEYFPRTFRIEYNPSTCVLAVDYELPSPRELPTLCEVRYVRSRDEYQEKHLTDAQLAPLYDAAIYQVALRVIYEVFQSDVASALDAVAFNGWVRTTDPGTGQETEACILTVFTDREKLESVNLHNVDAKACFRKLKGVACAKLHSLTPVAPLLSLSRDDQRFVSSRAVAASIAEGENIAAMDWEEFEHLVRELFELEYASVGGEVRVTRASRDGGVDAVVFDPDPIRGGKIVIQAKRYTATVGVSAVRDLYGTVLNEGANKGILVTTSDFGPDAYAFANGKPLALLNGNNILHLLARHGRKARIDLAEARQMAGAIEGVPGG